VTLPRIVIPGACIFITRRCFGRQFLLRPDSAVVALFRELLAAAAERYGLVLLGVVQMSNHYHIIAHDRSGRYPEFVGWLNAGLTRGVNRLRRRKDTMWEARQTSVVELGDADAVVAALAYVHLNPVAAGLVEDPSAWPGVLTGPEDVESGEVSTSQSGLKVEVPPTHAHLTPAQFRALLSARIKVLGDWVRAAHRQRGRSFGTPEDARRVPWQSSPTERLGAGSPTGSKGPSEPSQGLEPDPGSEPDPFRSSNADGSHDLDDEEALMAAFWARVSDPTPPERLPDNEPGEPLAPPDEPGEPPSGKHRPGASPRSAARARDINPTVKSSTQERRAGMLARLRAFRDAYTAALRAFKAGLPAVFPGGTWRLCHLLKLPSAPPPLPAWQLP
jgi:REP element-mobilizing transposase RayT